MKKMIFTGFIAIAALTLLACAGSTPKSDGASGMTGTWHLKVDTPSGSGTPTFVLTQTGDVLSGTYKGAFGEAPVKGRVTGGNFAIQFTSSGLDITYKGVVTGKQMTGDIDFGGQGKGTFTGQKD